MDGIDFVTTDATKWGTGKGAPLLATEADNNFWTCLSRIQALEANPAQPVSIDSIEEVDGALIIHLNDGTDQGPFPLPVSTVNFRGDWTNSTAYAVNDIVRGSRGLYLVLQNHTTPDPPAPFDPNAVQGGQPLYRFVLPGANYTISAYIPGTPGAFINVGEPMFVHVVTSNVTLPAGLPSSAAQLIGTIATDEIVCELRKGSTAIGTLTIAAGQGAGVFAFAAAVAFLPGEQLVIVRPPALDATARNLAISLIGLL